MIVGTGEESKVFWMVVVVVSLMGWYEKEESTMEGKERRICVCSHVLSAPFSDVAERKGTAVVSPFPPTGMRSCDKRSGLHKRIRAPGTRSEPITGCRASRTGNQTRPVRHAGP